MIFRYGDVMEEIHEEFSEIDPKALDNIVKIGLTTLKKELNRGEEMLMHHYIKTKDPDALEGMLKFYRRMSPEEFAIYVTERDLKRERNGEKSIRK